VEVIKRWFWTAFEGLVSVVVALARAIDAVGGWIEAAAFRVELATSVLLGRIPRETPRRWWSRSAETPVLVDIISMTDERLIASLIVYPVLEEPAAYAGAAQEERAEQIKQSFARVCGDLAWDTSFETYDLVWNPGREVWTTLDVAEPGDAVDGKRLEEYARRNGVPW
jgi:hypothetical protein